jgi:phospholipid-binding lipoprotein MlaA
MRALFSLLLVFTLIAAPVLAAERQPVAAHKSVSPVGRNDAMIEVSPIADPIEPFNRAVFGFNRFVDFLVIKPVTKVYTTVVPDFAQHSVTSFLSNLSAPIVMLNTALQGNWGGFETTLHRFVINSTLGVLGLVDVASDLGIQKVDADFGQTLGKWGVGQGFYLVLPIVGPSSARDGTGRLVDTVADPYNIAFEESNTEWPIWARFGAEVVDARARYGKEYDRTMKNAVDPYVTFRSIYAQHRKYVVESGVKGKTSVDAYSAAEAQ